jgi:SAM-dependent methyltransferase
MDEPLRPADTREAVRRGYDAVSHLYRGDDETPPAYAGWISELIRRLPPGARVLDAGCGCGVPVARDLARAGHVVTGVDASEVQVRRARRLVPQATFIRADLTAAAFPDARFDAVVALYSIIHIPVDEHPALLRRIAAWLRPGGRLLLTAGQRAGTGWEDRWLGGNAPMWWSHAGADAYHDWLTAAGLVVTAQGVVPEGHSGHSLFWARRPG